MTALSNRQRRDLERRNRADKADEAKGLPRRQHEIHVAPEVNGEDEVRATGKTGRIVKLKLSRLEYLAHRNVITPRQLSAGLWLAERWAGYFAPGVSSGIEDRAPGIIPSDPLARWSRGQRTMDQHGNVRTPPPTFRPRRPSEPRFASDGYSDKRLDSMQRWIRARRLIDHLARFDREVLLGVCVDGLPLFDAAKRALGSAERAGRASRLLRRAQEALWSGLTAIADEIEPSVANLPEPEVEYEFAEAS